MELLAGPIVRPFLLALEQQVRFAMLGREDRLVLILGRSWLDAEYGLLPLLAHVNIAHLQVDDWVPVLVRPEKLVLRLGLHPPEGLDRGVVEVGSTDIRIAFMAAPEVLLEQQVVGCSDVIVFVSLDASATVLQVKAELLQFCKDALVDRHAMVPHHDAAVERDVRSLFAPRMGVDLL